MPLGGRWIAGEHRDEGRRLGDRRRHRGAEGVQQGFRATERCLRRREVVLHRVQACQVLKDIRLSEGVVPDLVEVILTSLYPFLCGCWAPERGRGEPAEDIGQLPPVVHLAGVFGGALPGVFGGAGSGVVPVQRGLDLQGPADSQIVLAPSNSRRNSGSARVISITASSGSSSQAQQEGLNPRVGVLAVVTVGGGDALGVVERGLGLLELPGFDERRAQARIEPPEDRVVTRKQRGRAVQEVHRRDVVAAVVRGVPGRLEVPGRAVRQRGGLGIGGP